MKFSAEELPYTQLQALGLGKKDVLNLPAIDLNALLAGRRTSLTRFVNVELPSLGKIPTLDSKLSLHRNNDGSVSLRIHPINKIAPNIFDLPEKERQYLTEGRKDLLVYKVAKQNGDKDDMLIQYDPETREYVGKMIKEIIPPRGINNQTLTDKQREDWRNGKVVEVQQEKVRIDLKSTVGFVGSNVRVFNLENGANLPIGHLIKSSLNKTDDLKTIERQQTDFELLNNLRPPKEETKKWVLVKDDNLEDDVTISDPDRYVLVDKGTLGNRNVISLTEYESLTSDRSLEIAPQTPETGLKVEPEEQKKSISR